MSVGHGGDNSRHDGMQKLFILEYLEAKVQDAVNWYNDSHPGEHVTCEILDPYNTCHDFYVLIRTTGKEWFNESYKVYELIHERYQSDAGGQNLDGFKDAWMKKLGNERYNKMLLATLGEAMAQLHASKSTTTLYYTIDQVAKFYGIPDGRVWKDKIISNTISKA